MQNAEKDCNFSLIFDRLGDVLSDHFLRDRGELGPRAVFLTLVRISVLGTCSYRRALAEIRVCLGSFLGWVSTPSCSAFAQARRKLTGKTCEEAFQAIRARLTRAREVPREMFHGLRLVAFDGTRLGLPCSSELKEVFGCPLNQHAKAAACPQAGLVVLWDISSNQPRAWKLGPYTMGERAGAESLLSHIGRGDLLLADRGFPGLEFFHAVQATGAAFIIRMNTTTIAKSPEFVAFLAGTSNDQVVDFNPRTRTTQRFPGNEPLRIRFVADPVNRERVLATNLLDVKAYPAAEIRRIYPSRWNIETAFREGKNWHGLEKFHAQYADGIHQEVAAIMTFQFLVSELEAEVRTKIHDDITAGKQPPHAADDIPYTFNRLLIADMSLRLFLLAASNPEAVAAEWATCVKELWRGRQRKKHGRSFPRIAKNARSITRATRPNRSTS